MDRLTGMAAFVKAADTGSFAAAGAALGLSAQMIGKHVTAIEERLGARVLNRTTRRQSLTEVGRLYYERCRIVLAEADEAEAVVHQHSTTPQGRLRLTAPTTFGAYSVQPLVQAYLHQYPDVRVDLTLTDRFVDIIDEGFEVAIRLGDLADSTLMSRSLAPYELVPCAAPAYLAAHGAPATPADLVAHQCLGFAYASRPPLTDWRFTRDGQVHAVEVEHRLRINDSRLLLSAALDGLGVILGAEVMVREHLASGRLVRLLPAYAGPSRPLHILFPAARWLSPKVRAFVDMAVTALGAAL